MKQFRPMVTASIVVISLMGVLTGCTIANNTTSSATSDAGTQTSGNDTGTNTSASQKSEANNETTTKIGRTMHIGYYDVTVNSVKTASSIGGNDTSQGVYYILNVTLENTSRPEIILRSNMFSVVDKRGNKYNLDQTATMDEDIAGVYMFSDQLVQGQSRTSNLVFDLPKPQNHLVLEVISDSGSVLNIPFN